MPGTSCPEPLELMIWLDQEAENPRNIDEHLRLCPHCANLVDSWRTEQENLASCLDSLACPDFTGRIMARVMTASTETSLFYNALWYLLLTITTLAAALFYYLALPWWQANSLAVAGTRVYALITSIFFSADRISSVVLSRAFSGQLLLPAVCLTAGIILFHFYSKRRFNHA